MNNNMMGRNDQNSMMMGQNRQSNGYGQSMDGMGYNNNYYDPSGQPLFGQQYYQRSGNSEDFRSASRYSPPRGGGPVGNYDSSFSVLDDTGNRERRLQSYRVNNYDDFNWRSDGRRYSDRNMTPREREMRQRRIDDDNNNFDRQRRYDDMYRNDNNMNMNRRKGNNGIQQWQNNLMRQGNNDRRDDRYQDRYQDYGGGYPNGGNSNYDRYSNNDEFRDGRSGRRRDYGTPREREMRQMQDNRDLGRGYRPEGEYYKAYNDNSRYYDDNRSRNSGYNNRRDDNYDGRRSGRYDSRNNQYDNNKSSRNGRYDNNGRRKSSVWDNLKDAFKL